jgi:hypothetical protein
MITTTTLTMTTGIPLFEGHVRRLGEGSRAQLASFAERASPGVYRVTWDGTQLTATQRAPSRLFDGMPTRRAVSPYAGTKGKFPKPSSPCPYDAVRIDQVATLLTDARDEELYEACRASIIAWDGSSLVVPPEDAPGVASVAEAEVLAHFPVRRARVLVADQWPLLLINAVVGTCSLAGSDFPERLRADLDARLKEVR